MGKNKVPSQSSSGGKVRLGSITKNGNSELRVLLIHGARAVGRFASKRDDKLGCGLMHLRLGKESTKQSWR